MNTGRDSVTKLPRRKLLEAVSRPRILVSANDEGHLLSTDKINQGETLRQVNFCRHKNFSPAAARGFSC